MRKIVNTMRKYLVSRTVTEPSWANTTVLSADLPNRPAGLKAEPGDDTMTDGFGPVARTLVDRALLEEMLIREGTQARFELTDIRAVGPVALLSYRPA